jgi:hypothetical protein
MHSKCCPKTLVVLKPLQLAESDKYLHLANKTLKRKFPCNSVYTDNLLRRNYWQIRDTHAVYAIAPLKENKIDGGTAWAVQMAIDRWVPTLYLYDLNSNRWHKWSHAEKEWDYVIFDQIVRPGLCSIYTGIGSRLLNKQGEQAIRSLYG